MRLSGACNLNWLGLDLYCLIIWRGSEPCFRYQVWLSYRPASSRFRPLKSRSSCRNTWEFESWSRPAAPTWRTTLWGSWTTFTSSLPRPEEFSTSWRRKLPRWVKTLKSKPKIWIWIALVLVLMRGKLCLFLLYYFSWFFVFF